MGAEVASWNEGAVGGCVSGAGGASGAGRAGVASWNWGEGGGSAA